MLIYFYHTDLRKGGIIMYFKTCPKCTGDVDVIQDHFGPYKMCLQCGWVQDIDKTPSEDTHPVRPKVKKQNPRQCPPKIPKIRVLYKTL